MSQQETIIPSAQDVELEAQGVLGEMMPTGAIDSEPEALNTIVIDMKKGNITTVEAMDKIHELQNSRQDYH